MRKLSRFFASAMQLWLPPGTSDSASARNGNTASSQGFPAFVSIARGRVRLFLSEHTGDARPDTLIYLRLRDLDVIAKEFGVAVQQMPWGGEVKICDPDRQPAADQHASWLNKNAPRRAHACRWPSPRHARRTGLS